LILKLIFNLSKITINDIELPSFDTVLQLKSLLFFYTLT